MLKFLIILAGISNVLSKTRNQFDNSFGNRAKGTSWENVNSALEDAISRKVFPGAAAIVLNSSNIMHEFYVGHQTYDETSEKIDNMTLWDMASCTKVLATTTAVMMISERVEGLLDMKVMEIFPEFAVNGKSDITVRNCLLHNAGFPADPIPNFWDQQFGCPETAKKYPQLDFNCMIKIRAAWANTTLENKVGTTFLYSDLSFMTLSYIVGHYAKLLEMVSELDLAYGCPVDNENCYFEAFVRKHIIKALGLVNIGFLPKDTNRCPPAWFDKTYRRRLVKGEVSDGNSFANGGVFGHAGIFSNARDVAKIMKELLFENKLIRKDTVDNFIRVFDPKFSSRALGWDTNTYKNSSCSALSESTFLHTGYTGTLVCGDPVRKIVTILLTNRVYPDDNPDTTIKVERMKFNQLVREIVDEN